MAPRYSVARLIMRAAHRFFQCHPAPFPECTPLADFCCSETVSLRGTSGLEIETRTSKEGYAGRRDHVSSQVR